MSDEEWVKVAMTDDSVVVDVLLRLHQAESPPPRPKPRSPALQLDWTVRQRRSKSTPRYVESKKKAEPTRASPTTPLSWSGATSASGGADGFEESSRLSKPLDAARSKVAATTETTTTKRSRKKKTLAELKEEESLLLKERRNLKNELASLRLNVEKQRATNESLKRMKLDLQSHQVLKTVEASVPYEEAISNQPLQTEVACHPTSSVLPTSVACCGHDTQPLLLPLPSPSKCSSKVQEVRCQETSFLLPDLNLPFGDDSGSEILYGMS